DSRRRAGGPSTAAARACGPRAPPLSCLALFTAVHPLHSGGIRSMAIQKVGVLGCGLMGSGIAQVSAQAGFPTLVREISPNALEKGLGSITKFLQAGVDKGKVPPYELDKVKKNLSGTVKLEDLADCDLIVEAAPENLKLKQELFGAMEGIAKPAAIFASNTSSLSITELSNFCKRPERFLGLHFFNPVPL